LTIVDIEHNVPQARQVDLR